MERSAGCHTLPTPALPQQLSWLAIPETCSSVVEQRYRVVLAVERGESKILMAAQFGLLRR